MRLIALAELRALPKGSVFSYAKYNGAEWVPDGGIYIWEKSYEDNDWFGYAIPLVPEGYIRSWEEKGIINELPSRFYYRQDSITELLGDEHYYLYEKEQIESMIELLQRSLKSYDQGKN